MEYAPITSLSEENVLISWQPANSEGSQVTDYFLEIYNPVSQVWTKETNYCISIVGTSCEVPMNWFTAQYEYVLSQTL